MREAVDAGSGAPENTQWTRVQLAALLLKSGHVDGGRAGSTATRSRCSPATRAPRPAWAPSRSPAATSRGRAVVRPRRLAPAAARHRRAARRRARGARRCGRREARPTRSSASSRRSSSAPAATPISRRRSSRRPTRARGRARPSSRWRARRSPSARRSTATIHSPGRCTRPGSAARLCLRPCSPTASARSTRSSRGTSERSPPAPASRAWRAPPSRGARAHAALPPARRPGRAAAAGEAAVMAKWHSRRVPLGPPPLAVAALALAVLVPAADAHPLGNFTVNQYTRLDVAQGGVSVRYVLDMAEIPTFQRRQIVDANGDGRIVRGRGRASANGSSRSSRRICSCWPTGSRCGSRSRTARVASRKGQGGLSTTRLDARFRAVGLDARRCAAHAEALQHVRHRPRRLARAAGGARRGCGGALDGRRDRRSHEGADALPGRPAAFAARHPRRDDGGRDRLGRPRGAGDPGARRLRAGHGLQLGQGRRRLRLADRERRRPERVRRARGARAGARVRHVPRAHAGARQDDGGGVPRGHARDPRATR